MTTPAEMSPQNNEEVKIVDVRRRIGYTIASMANTPYRQLQYIAKICGVPCNLKKEILKMVIRAKLNGHYEEVELLLKQVREARLLRRKQKAKLLEKSKAVAKTELVEENNNEMTPKEGQETFRHNKVRELLHSMVKMSSAHNVTIQQMSTHTRYRALITPSTWRSNKCGGVSPSSTSTTQQNPEAASSNSTVIKYATPNTGPVVASQGSYHASSSTATATVPLVTNQWNNPQFGYRKTNNGPSSGPGTAVSVRETLLQQYHRNPVHYEPAQRIVDRTSWNGGIVDHRPNIVAAGYQPLPTFHSLHYNNQLYNNIQPFNNNQLCSNIQSFYNNNFNNQLYNTDPQTSEICYQSKPISNLYQASQQYERASYGGFQYGIQRASTPFNMDGNFVGAQNSNAKVSSTNAEPYSGLQADYPGYNRVPVNSVPYENQVPAYGVIPDTVSPNIIDVTKLSAESEKNLDTDLGLLANMAMTKTQEVIDGTRSQHNNGLLVINESVSNRPFGQDELVACDTKPLTQEFPTWNNFLELMSSNLSPGVTNKKAVVYCKYGCRTPTNSRQQQLEHEVHCYQQPIQCPLATCTYVGPLRYISTHIHNAVVYCKYGCRTPTNSRQQQLEHEVHCYQQPIQCPLAACTYVGPLRYISTHIHNDHNNDVRSDGNGSFFIDFSDGKCSFGKACSSLSNCPKKFCFPQLVNGRLFLIKVIGNFDSMQVIVYVQYVNDHHSRKSYVACEVVRQDGVPYQYQGEVLPLTYNPLHIISRRNCLIFNMNVEDSTQNLFVLHTKIQNSKI